MKDIDDFCDQTNDDFELIKNQLYAKLRFKTIRFDQLEIGDLCRFDLVDNHLNQNDPSKIIANPIKEMYLYMGYKQYKIVYDPLKIDECNSFHPDLHHAWAEWDRRIRPESEYCTMFNVFSIEHNQPQGGQIMKINSHNIIDITVLSSIKESCE